jgi:hypothetical protein
MAAKSKTNNGDNMNNAIHESSRIFKNKKQVYELQLNSKNKNIKDLYQGIYEFTNCYQLGTNLVKDENGDLFAKSQNILNRWKITSVSY